MGGEEAPSNGYEFSYAEGTPEYHFVHAVHQTLGDLFERDWNYALICYIALTDTKNINKFSVGGKPLFDLVPAHFLDSMPTFQANHIIKYVQSIEGDERDRIQLIKDVLDVVFEIENLGYILTRTLQVRGNHQHMDEVYEKKFSRVLATFLVRTFPYKDPEEV